MALLLLLIPNVTHQMHNRTVSVFSFGGFRVYLGTK